MRIDRIHQQYDVSIKFVQFPLHPDTPVEGRTLEALFNCGPNEIAEKNQHMTGLMQAEGLPYGKRTHTYNSRRAQELAKWAEKQSGGDAIHNALFTAYFVDGKNIAEEAVLLEVCRSTGLDADQAKSALQNDQYKQAVDEDWALCRQYGVTGVPTYVMGQKGIVGAQPFEAIESLLLDGGVARRELEQ